MIELDWEGIAEFLVFGSILGDKTMIKRRSLPRYPIPEVTLRPSSSLDEVYYALRRAVENAFKKEPNCAITLSGGQDSRIAAGIVAELGFDIPALTYYSAFEAKVAAKVCAKLSLKHYFVPRSYDISDAFLEKVIKVTGELGGTKGVVNIASNLRLQQALDKLGVKTNITTTAFNEVLGTDLRERNFEAYFNTFASRSFPEWYRVRAYRSLCEYCSHMSIDEIILKVTVQELRRRQVKLSYKIPDSIHIILDADVLSAIYSLPYHERQPTVFQRRILKNYFPELYKIPSTTYYVPHFPSQINAWIVRALARFEKFQRRRGRDKPIGTFSSEYFFERNRRLLLEKLKKVPLPQNRLQPLVHKAIRILDSERVYEGDFLNRILTYVFLVDYCTRAARISKERS